MIRSGQFLFAMIGGLSATPFPVLWFQVVSLVRGNRLDQLVDPDLVAGICIGAGQGLAAGFAAGLFPVKGFDMECRLVTIVWAMTFGCAAGGAVGAASYSSMPVLGTGHSVQGPYWLFYPPTYHALSASVIAAVLACPKQCRRTGLPN